MTFGAERVINTLPKGKNKKGEDTMTKEQIEKAIANVIAEREEIFDELERIENEEEPEIGTPQWFIDELHEQATALGDEYNELCEALRNA